MTKPQRWNPMMRTTKVIPGEYVEDYLPTPNWPIDILMTRELFSSIVWECACGDGRMARRLKSWGYKVIGSDKYDRGYGHTGVDFFDVQEPYANNIISNPPFKYAQQFVEKALELNNVTKFAFLLRTLFVESKRRRHLFESNPPKKIICIADRVMFDGSEEPGGGFSVSWYIWDKSYRGPTIYEWAWFSTL